MNKIFISGNLTRDPKFATRRAEKRSPKWVLL